MAVLMLASACGSGDKCEKAFDKMSKLMADKGKSPDKAKAVEECRKGLKDHPESEKILDCINGISGTPSMADMEKCMNVGGELDDYRKKSKKTEAQLQLNKLGKNAKTVFITNNEFPKGKVGPSPAAPCCQGAGAKCAVDANAWKDPVWQSLEFQIDEPHLFQYTYESADGKSFEARAIGDLDCDTQMITYTLKGTVDNGNPKVEVTEPTTQD